MKTIGLTGGIGSGKTTIAKWFQEKGVPVYNSDLEAKELMNENLDLIGQLTNLLGEQTYIDGEYNRTYVSSKVFNDQELLNQLNAIVHPAVFKHFDEWLDKQNSLFIVKEAAILFESGSYKDCDYVISVIADEKIRIERVVKRDQLSEEQILGRMRSQWTDEQRIEKSDFIIENNSDLESLKLSFEKVYNEIVERINIHSADL